MSAYPEELINRNIQGKSVWAPWYTLHKLYSGLIDQYLYADNQQALSVVTKMGDWAYNKLKPLSEETRRLMIRNEFGESTNHFIIYMPSQATSVIVGWRNISIIMT